MIHSNEIDILIEQAAAGRIPAVALAVYQHGQLVLERTAGCLDPETDRRSIEATTLFDLASVTKLFTVTAFLQLVAQGRVTLQTPVVQVIPEFGAYGPRPIAGGQDPHTLQPQAPLREGVGPVDPTKVTFYHLLTHTSGLASWWALFLEDGPVPPRPGQNDPVSRQARITRALDVIAQRPFVDELGHDVHYSDNGLILLGEAVTRLAGASSLAEVIAGPVLTPLGLARSIVFNPRQPELCPATELDARWRGRRCRGEVHDENAASLSGIAGHAGLFGSAAALAQFGATWLQAVRGELSNWLPGDLARDAVQIKADDRGLGWVLKTSDRLAGQLFSPHSFGHTGFTGTMLWNDPQRDLSVALLTNRVYHGRDAAAIVALRPAVFDAVCRAVDG